LELVSQKKEKTPNIKHYPLVLLIPSSKSLLIIPRSFQLLLQTLHTLVPIVLQEHIFSKPSYWLFNYNVLYITYFASTILSHVVASPTCMRVLCVPIFVMIDGLAPIHQYLFPPFQDLHTNIPRFKTSGT
jgi:hypothetical protein